LQDFLNARSGYLHQESLLETLQRLQRDWRLSLHQATFLIDHMLWHQMIDFDISRPIHRGRPPIPGGRALRMTIRMELSGGAQ
jgi:hypothetical protein